MRSAALGCIFLISGTAAWGPHSAQAVECGGGPVLAADPLQRGADGRIEVLQIRAVLDSDGAGVHRKHPLGWKRRTRPQTIPLSDGALCLRIRFADGQVAAIPFDAYVEGDAIDGPRLFGGFTLEVPVPGDRRVAEVEIARKCGAVLITWTTAEIPQRS